MIIVAIIGFVIIGPERSRELAVQAGRAIRTAMNSTWWRELTQVSSALRDLPTTLVRMAELEDELKQVRTDLNRAAHPLREPWPDQSSSVPTNDPWGIQNSISPQQPAPDDTPDSTQPS